MADPTPADRTSRLGGAAVLLHADLHNHSMFSDGDGDPEKAFATMRAAGLDAAALTDHASIPRHHVRRLDPADYPDEAALRLARMAPVSLDDAGWSRTGALADAADEPGRFTALRGFEWTEPWLGHANVWFSEEYLPVRTPGRIGGLHGWLAEHSPGALFGYNHPGREPGRFGGFALGHDLVARMVSLEMFNRYADYLFAGWDGGHVSPLLECLRSGWRPGLVGVSDEHGSDYGLAGKGRTGLWAPEHSRSGVRAALLSRRVFATREPGLRLDARLEAVPMGGVVRRDGGAAMSLHVDLAGGGYAVGAPLEVQVLGDDGGRAPAVVCRVAVRAGEPVRLRVPDSRSPWLALRVADARRPANEEGPADHPATAYGVAYGSPWWLGSTVHD